MGEYTEDGADELEERRQVWESLPKTNTSSTWNRDRVLIKLAAMTQLSHRRVTDVSQTCHRRVTDVSQTCHRRESLTSHTELTDAEEQVTIGAHPKRAGTTEHNV